MTLKLTEIIDYVMLETGQFIVGDITNLVLDKNKVWLLVKRALGYLDKYVPVTERQLVQLYGGYYDFPDSTAPDWISKVYPTGDDILYANLFWGGQSAGSSLTEFVYRYTKPRLTVSNAGTVEIYAQFKHTYAIEYDGDPTNNVIKDVTIDNVDLTEYRFMKMVTGLFLVAIGKSRRAFTLNDFPLQMDADAMISDGNNLIADAEQQFQDTGKWYLGIGG